MSNLELNSTSLLYLLQLASPALPVGAYSYSEGIETLVDRQIIRDYNSLKHWLERELELGAIRVEAAIALRAYRANQNNDLSLLLYWNSWLSAARETEELRNQSWKMGRALSRLIAKIHPETEPFLSAIGNPCNYAVVFGVAAASFALNERSLLLGYLHSWATNLIGVGVKLIPLGQTQGQQLMIDLQRVIEAVTKKILTLEDDDLTSWGWGLSLASMAHETLYSRLFRS